MRAAGRLRASARRRSGAHRVRRWRVPAPPLSTNILMTPSSVGTGVGVVLRDQSHDDPHPPPSSHRPMAVACDRVARACAVCSCRTCSRPACGARPAAPRAWRKNSGPAPAANHTRSAGSYRPRAMFAAQHDVLAPEYQQAEYPARQQAGDLEQHRASQHHPRQARWRRRRSATQSSIRAAQGVTSAAQHALREQQRAAARQRRLDERANDSETAWVGAERLINTQAQAVTSITSSVHPAQGPERICGWPRALGDRSPRLLRFLRPFRRISDLRG
jgi:hypothetical protein